MNLAAEAQRLQNGAPSVTFVARGGSMTPRVSDGEIVTVVPVSSAPTKGDVVLVKLRGHWYLHLVSAVQGSQIQISNNKGYVNGWVQASKVVGVLA